MRALALASLLLIAGCDAFESGPSYTGPVDYAYTLTVRCFCLNASPVRVTVADGAVVGVEALSNPENVPQDQIDDLGLTLSELTALAARAERDADDVTVRYDRRYGYPTQLDIDWDTGVSDEEVSYTATDFEAR